MRTVRNILKAKGGGIYSIDPVETVYEAIAMMAEKEVGALLVMHEGHPVGIISERDYTRKVILKDKSSKADPGVGDHDDRGCLHDVPPPHR